MISPIIASLRRESLFAQAFPSPALSRAPTIHIICPGTNIFHGLDVVKDELHSGRNSPVESLGMLRSREPDTDSRYMVEPNTSGCGISSRYGGPRPCFLIRTMIPRAAYAALRISAGSRMTWPAGGGHDNHFLSANARRAYDGDNRHSTAAGGTGPCVDFIYLAIRRAQAQKQIAAEVLPQQQGAFSAARFLTRGSPIFYDSLNIFLQINCISSGEPVYNGPCP